MNKNKGPSSCTHVPSLAPLSAALHNGRRPVQGIKSLLLLSRCGTKCRPDNAGEMLRRCPESPDLSPPCGVTRDARVHACAVLLVERNRSGRGAEVQKHDPCPVDTNHNPAHCFGLISSSRAVSGKRAFRLNWETRPTRRTELDSASISSDASVLSCWEH
jgi:hypothetical protein